MRVLTSGGVRLREAQEVDSQCFVAVERAVVCANNLSDRPPGVSAFEEVSRGLSGRPCSCSQRRPSFVSLRGGRGRPSQIGQKIGTSSASAVRR